MHSARFISWTLAASFALPVTLPAQGFPIAPPGTEGIRIFVGSANPIIATYLGNSAAFSNNLYLMLDALGNPGDDGNLANDLFIFNNHSSPIGGTLSLGSFVTGTELIFRLFVTNTSQHFFTGPGSRNPDGVPHARVLNNWQPGTTLVSFEDLLNGPFDYNDLSFSFTNTVAGVVPEPASFVLLASGLLALIAVRRRVKR